MKSPVTLEVLNPIGGYSPGKLPAPRVETLAGKKIGEVSNGMFDAHKTFPIIRKMLKERFPDAEIVPWTEFPSGYMGLNTETGPKAVKEKGCDVAIVGNAG